MRSPRAQADGRAIRAVLLNVWDPIGVAGIAQAQSEYDAYIWPILSLLQRGVSAEELTEHLVDVAVSQMGLGEDRISASAAARALLGLPLASAALGAR